MAVHLTIILCIVDAIRAVCLFSDYKNRVLCIVTTNIFYIVADFISLSWMNFAISYFYTEFKKFRPLAILAIGVVLAQIVTLLVNFFVPIFFAFDEKCNFHGTPYRFILVIVQYILFSYVFVLSIIKTAKEKNPFLKRMHYSVLLFSVIPLACGLLQMFFHEYPVDAIGFMLGCFIIFAFNVSKESEQRNKVHKKQREEMTKNCLKILYDEESIDNAISKLLALISRYYGSDRACIFEINQPETLFSNSYEFCNENVSRQKDNLQDIDITVIESFINDFKEKGEHFLPDIDKIMDIDSKAYHFLKEQQIKSLIAFPLKDNDRIVGFLTLTNPEFYIDDMSVIRIVSVIIYSEIMRRKNADTEHKVIEAMMTSYLTVSYVNLETDEQIIYKVADHLKDMSSKFYSTGMSYYIDNNVSESERADVHFWSSPFYIMNQFKNRNFYTIRYLDVAAGKEPMYVETTFIKADAEGKCAVVLSSDITETVMEANDEKVAKHRYDKIFQTMASEFTALYYYDLKTNYFIPYSVSSRIMKDTGELLNTTKDYSVVFEKFVNNSVHPDDRQKMMDSFHSMETVLQTKKSYTTIFRRKYEKEYLYSSMYVVKLDDVDLPPTSVVIGFSERNGEIESKFIREALSQDCTAIYMCNFEDNIVRAFKDVNHMDVERYDRKSYEYVINDFANYLTKKSKNLWLKFADIDYTKNLLKENPVKDIFLELEPFNGTKIYRRCSWHVVDWKNGYPATIVAAFSPIDAEMLSMILSAGKVEEEKDLLEMKQVTLEYSLDKVQAAEKAKAGFLVELAHEIRSPLNAVVGYMRIAQREIENREKVVHCINRTLEAGMDMYYFMNDINDMVFLNNSNLELEEDEV
ncbi:MAG: hypothetical protein K5839_00440, partial [Treponemataceae bacterium]|nr:hypothetical protein [Treponemataceae bacterium]